MKITQKLKPSFKLKQRVLIFGLLIGIFSACLTIVLNFSRPQDTYAATTGDYRTRASGNWNSTAVWSTYNGSSWVNATSTPNSGSNVITILSGYTVTITASVTVDQVVVNNGGTLIQNGSVTLTLNNGTGTELDVAGIYKNAGTVVINTGSTIVFQSNGKYQHNFTTTAGTIPAATWTAGSICEIIGYTSNSTSPSGIQSFSNFIWNCPSQANAINLNGALTTINNDLTISSTGSSGSLLLANSSASTLNVGGDFTLSGGTLSLSNGGSIISTISISGNYIQSAGTFSVVTGSGSTGKINVTGDWTHSGGTLTVGGNSSTSALVTFNNSGSQNFTAVSPTVTGNIDYTINSGSTLILGTSVVNGRNFTLASGGGISLSSLAGITTSGSTGNVQVSGTRSFSTGANYTYTGASTQVFGSAFPTTVNNLTINSGGTFTLTSNYTVSGILTLSNGKINTGSNKLILSNSSTSGITGYSSSNYIIGNLDRRVSSTGTYYFPVGTASKYELIALSLNGTSGFTRVNAKFTSTDPNSATYDVDSIEVNGVNMSELLDYGYWTLTPNTSLTGGTFDVELLEEGYTNSITDGTVFSLLSRLNTTSEWSSPGTQNDYDQGVVGTAIKAKATALDEFGIFAIGIGEFAAFSNPVLNSGTAGSVGAVYIFPRVVKSVDAWVEITKIEGGASLNAIDDESGIGYTPSFQPFINYPANTAGFTAFIEWKIKFKKTGTSTDTTLAKLTATGLDVDGYSSSGKGVREYISASMPYSYNLDPYTDLTITNDSGRYRALGGTNDLSGIDSTKKQAMYELNYRNVNTIYYRTGALNTTTGSATRQTSLFFKSFNLTNKNIALPIKLISFDAILKYGKVNLYWATASEVNNDYFSIERSTDGRNFKTILTKRGAGNSTTRIEYEDSDPAPPDGYVYYRLKQTDFDGKYTYSNIETIKNSGDNETGNSSLELKTISPNPFKSSFRADYFTNEKGKAEITLLSAKGEVVFNQTTETDAGFNTFFYDDEKALPSGYYFLIVQFKDQKTTKKILKL